MSKSRFIAGVLTATMALSVAPVYAVEQNDIYDTIMAQVNGEYEVSEFQNTPEITREQQEVTTITDTTVAYAVEGGNIYLDTTTGTITSADYWITSAVIPSTINGVAVTSIGDWAFGACMSLTNIEIPNCVITIGADAFFDCTSLTSIEIPNGVTFIGDWAFGACTSLTNIKLPNSLTTIGDQVFIECINLENIEIPSSVTSIGIAPFGNCTNLIKIDVSSESEHYSSQNGNLYNKDQTEIIQYVSSNERTSYTISSSVTTIGQHAFAGCANLSSIEVSKNNPNYSSVDGNLFNKNKTVLIQYALASEEISYEIPSGVTSIEAMTFSHCNNLENIKIPTSVTEIGFSAFFSCSSLKSIVIPNSVTSIGAGVFATCSNLTDVYFTGSEEEWSEISIDTSYNNNDDLLNATIHFNSEMPETDEELEDDETPETDEELEQDENPETEEELEQDETPETEEENEEPEILQFAITGVPSSVKVDDTFNLSVENSENDDEVYFVSSDTSVISITETGVATAKSAGTATISVKKGDETASTTIKVTAVSTDGNTGGSTGGSTGSTGGSTDTSTGSTSTDTTVDTSTDEETTEDTTDEEVDTTVDTEENNEIFADVLGTDWYFDAVNYAIENGLFTGVTENSFAPNANMSRAMLWTVLYRNAGETGPTTGSNWYLASQKWANEQGISDGSNPNGDMTREELATMLYRSAGEPEVTTNSISAYNDGSNVSSWAKNAMNWAVEQGIISGKSNNNLAPTDNTTRAEVATMLMRFLG